MGEPVRWGVLGCARVFERRMAPAFAALGEDITLLAIASRDSAKAEATAARHNIPRAYGFYEALLHDPDIEAVYIPLPNDQHAPWTLQALAAGKHVLCDKPAALTLWDATLMARTAQSLGLRFIEGFMYRFHPQHARIQEIVQSGELGEVVDFAGTFTYPAPPPAPGGIRWNPQQGGGAFWDTGVYPLNAARFHFGTEPIAVSAASRWDAATGVDLHTTALLEWADGRTATITGGFDQAFTTVYEVSGFDGVVRADRAFQVGDSGVTIMVRVGDTVRVETLPHFEQYAAQLRHFCAGVRDPALPLWPAENGVAQARVAEAVMRSARQRRRVRLDEVDL